METPRPNDREHRIRAALALDRGPLPEVNSAWLRRYHAHLAKSLSLPFQACHAGDLSRVLEDAPHVTIVALDNPDEHPQREWDGLTCLARQGDQLLPLPLVDIEVDPDDVNFELLDDYWYWFWNYRFDPSI